VNRRRLALLLAAHALADGRSVRDAVLLSGAGLSGQGAARMDAGDLQAGLESVGVDPELVRLAEAWPPAMLPAVRRLDSVPTADTMQLQVLETLGYLLCIGVFQLIALTFTMQFSAPLAEDLQLTGWMARLEWLGMGQIGVGLFILLLTAAGVVVKFRPQNVPLWGRWFRSARTAALTAGLLDSSPPDDVRAQLAMGGTGSVLDHETLLTLSVARMDEARGRLVAGTRFVGISVLVSAALLMTWATYASVAEVGL
jgi:hypothetical protein